jgi:hypothetical protein
VYFAASIVNGSMNVPLVDQHELVKGFDETSHDLRKELWAKVVSGAQTLDAKGYKWRTHTKDSDFDMSKPTTCIFGKIFGTFVGGYHKIGLGVELFSYVYVNGFKAHDPSHYPFLTQAWKTVADEKL